MVPLQTARPNYLVPRTSDDLDRLVSEAVQEGAHIDFKSARAFGNIDKFKNDLSGDVSAFANSGGGCVVIGIEEDQDGVARAVDGSQQLDTSALWFENALLQRISPRIPGMEVIWIRHSTGNCFAIHAPMSLAAPHQGHDMRFHARRQRRNEPMEWYELEMLRLRSAGVSDDVFGGIVIDGNTIFLAIENKRDNPIYNVKFYTDNIALRELAQKYKVVREKLSVVPARSNLKFRLGQTWEWFGNALLARETKYELNFFLEPAGNERVIIGELHLQELVGAAVEENDMDRLIRTLDKGIAGIVSELRKSK